MLGSLPQKGREAVPINAVNIPKIKYKIPISLFEVEQNHLIKYFIFFQFLIPSKKKRDLEGKGVKEDIRS